MTSCRERDRQHPPFVLDTHVEIPMRGLFGNKGKFAGTQVQMMLLNLKSNRSFQDEKGLIVTMPVEWNSLLWRDSILEQGKGATGVGCESKKCHDGGGNLEDLSFPERFRLHDLVFPFVGYCFFLLNVAHNVRPRSLGGTSRRTDTRCHGVKDTAGRPVDLFCCSHCWRLARFTLKA